MYVTLLFWLGLALPGYVLLRRFTPDDLKSGLLGTLGLSYLAVLGALSPVSILCYVVGAPLWVFSGACILAVLLALYEMIRRRWWGDLGRLLLAGLCLEMLLVLVDVVMGARVGTFMIGDARVHLARIRFIVDHGFSNLDPYVSAAWFFPTYHTNILHALAAACVQITGQDHFAVWFVGLAWAKILVAAGSYWLAWCIFQKPWPAWASAVFVIAVVGPVNYVLYPNKLCPYWAIPCIIGFAIQALQGPIGWRSCVKLGVAALVLGQLHGLYALFAVLLLGPILGVACLYKIIRKRPDRWISAACLLAISVGLPFPVISKLKTPPPAVAEGTAQAGQPDFNALTKAPVTPDANKGQFIELDSGWVMRNPRRGFGAGYGFWRFGLLILGAALAMTTPHRRRAGCMIAVTAVAVAVLFFPPLCTALVRALGRDWILGRFEFVLRLAVIVLVPSAAVYWLNPIARFWWSRGPVSVVILVLAVLYANHKPSGDWTNYRKKAFAPDQARFKEMEQFRGFRRALVKNIPAGETVLTDPNLGMWFVTFADCHIVAPESSSNGVADLVQRRADLWAMLVAKTPWPRRRELLAKYNISYFLPGKTPTGWTQGHIRRNWGDGQLLIFWLNTE